MQEPAKTALDVIFHDEARKHESMVFQFQSICDKQEGRSQQVRSSWFVMTGSTGHTEILQPFPPPIPPMPPMLWAAPVAAVPEAAAVVVAIDIPP